MTRTEFEVWAREAEELREQALRKYAREEDTEVRKSVATELENLLNHI